MWLLDDVVHDAIIKVKVKISHYKVEANLENWIESCYHLTCVRLCSSRFSGFVGLCLGSTDAWRPYNRVHTPYSILVYLVYGFLWFHLPCRLPRTKLATEDDKLLLKKKLILGPIINPYQDNNFESLIITLLFNSRRSLFHWVTPKKEKFFLENKEMDNAYALCHRLSGKLFMATKIWQWQHRMKYII